MTIQILNFSFNNAIVSFRADGFLNATAIAKYFGKQPRDYLINQQTQEYIAALAEHLSIKGNPLIEEKQIVIIKKGSSYNGGGTWLHPKLAVDFARWLDPKFAVWCDEQIEHILSGCPQPDLPPEQVSRSFRALNFVVRSLPYLLAYYHLTEPSVRALNRRLCSKVHDRFQDSYFQADYLAGLFQIPQRDWRDVVEEIRAQTDLI